MVAERIVKIPQTDLVTMRVQCKACHKIAELLVEEAAISFNKGTCHFCGHLLVPPTSSGAQSPFAHLATAWQEFKRNEKHMAVDFVIAEP